MANRLGEFALVVDPRNDGHIVATSAVSRLFEAIEFTLALGLRVQHSEPRSVELYITASPEVGSVRFWLMAGAVLAAAADASQITGVDVRDVIHAIGHLRPELNGDRPPSAPATKIAADPHFVDSVSKLVEVASESGYGSVRIEADGIKVELVEQDPAQIDETLRRLRQQLSVFEQRDRELGPPGQYVDNVRRVDPERVQLQREMDRIDYELQRLERLRRRQIDGSFRTSR